MGRYPYLKIGVRYQPYRNDASDGFDQRVSVTAINKILKFAGISNIDSDLYVAILVELENYVSTIHFKLLKIKSILEKLFSYGHWIKEYGVRRTIQATDFAESLYAEKSSDYFKDLSRHKNGKIIFKNFKKN